jgi:hypothetical protein
LTSPSWPANSAHPSLEYDRINIFSCPLIATNGWLSPLNPIKRMKITHIMVIIHSQYDWKFMLVHAPIHALSLSWPPGHPLPPHNSSQSLLLLISIS